MEKVNLFKEYEDILYSISGTTIVDGFSIGEKSKIEIYFKGRFEPMTLKMEELENQDAFRLKYLEIRHRPAPRFSDQGWHNFATALCDCAEVYDITDNPEYRANALLIFYDILAIDGTLNWDEALDKIYIENPSSIITEDRVQEIIDYYGSGIGLNLNILHEILYKLGYVELSRYLEDYGDEKKRTWRLSNFKCFMEEDYNRRKTIADEERLEIIE